jgi:hypothetical protein
VTGYRHSGRAVVAAAVIMTAVFGAFVLDLRGEKLATGLREPPSGA